MSQDYGYESQFDPDPRPRRASGCRRGCVIAGIILLVLIVLAVVGVIYFVQHIMSGLTEDPKEVTARLVQRFPNAKTPPGYTGRVGMRFSMFKIEFDLLIFAKDDAQMGENRLEVDGDALILVSLAVPGQNEDALDGAMQTINREGRVVKRNPYTVRAGEYEFEGFRQVVEHREGGVRVSQPQILVPLGSGTMVVMQGIGDEVDEAGLKEFLKSIAKDVPTAKKVGEKDAAPEKKEADPEKEMKE